MARCFLERFMKAQEIVDEICEGVANALSTCRLFLGIEGG